jgi:NarL family two-component system sensor histidine kinase LiaS
MGRFRSLSSRMVLSHVLVAALTSVIGVMLLLALLALAVRNISAADYRGLAFYAVQQWLMGEPDGQPNKPEHLLPSGFSLIVSPEHIVLFSHGETPCRANVVLAECAPDLVGLPVGERFYTVGEERWAEVVINMIHGEQAIIRRGPPFSELFLAIPGFPIYGNVAFIVAVSLTIAVLAVPLALAMAWLWARPLGHRLSTIAQASRRFANGEFQVRINDPSHDEVGDLAHQFDDMADMLEQNVSVLRDMAQRNAELAQQAEQAAIQAERVRLSRDLHDAIAQRLFSLSVSTASLPDLIQRDQIQGVEQARAIASIAEQTLLDLRSLLLELRPSSVMQRGLSEALNALCDEWQTAYHLLVECSLMLTGKYIPAAIEDVLYRVAQEALNNVAKHAKAKSVQLSAVEGQRQITLSVTDDGQGFADTMSRANGKFGLISMQERARSVGGSLVIESDTSRGTTIRLTLPLEREKTT